MGFSQATIRRVKVTAPPIGAALPRAHAYAHTRALLDINLKLHSPNYFQSLHSNSTNDYSVSLQQRKGGCFY